MPKSKPQRKCLGCNTSYPKNELMRVVRTPEGEYLLDTTGKKAGRGAYICHSIKCYEAVRKNNGFERAFKSKINADMYEELSNKLFNDKPYDR